MKSRISCYWLVLGFMLVLAGGASAAEAVPIRALLIAGGCCHDYAKQHEILVKGIQGRALVRVDVVWTDDKSTNPPLPIYERADWAKGYDVILHDECAASMRDGAVLTRILEAHKEVPSVHLHCAMHSFRTGDDRWFKHLGLQSNSHGPQEPIAITFVDKAHPITQTLEDWTTIKEELYNNVNVFDAHPLAMGRQMVKGQAVDAIVAWTNEKAGARSFSTTLGHNSETVADARYLELVTRGLLWACDKLKPEYLVPYQGKNEVTFVPAKPVEAPKPAPAAPAGLPVKATASSEESGKQNFAWKAVDGDPATRWCASGSAFPQWLQLEFEKPQDLTGIEISWESQNNAYQHKIEIDGKLVVADSTERSHAFDAKQAKKIVITCLGTNHGGWASIWEVKFKGPGIVALSPNRPDTADKIYEKEGNVPPKMVKLTPEQEAAILKDVKVAEGFEVSLFANSAAANYPVFVAAATDGTLYVSSDGNGSLGRNPKRGRVIRLRDLDGDGRADETKVFCEVDSPRGLVWDHDRLYLVHPPHLSEFIDADGDGVAEKQNILVKDIAFGFKDRPADHTTNGLSLGIDGWLYIAVGDFGFMKATGTDGRTLQMRGGGVVRVRPDGTGLETYSTGTRNILEVAISPLMDLFARDNTNDGGGWNVRFHHFTGLDDHGYPRLYKNFNDECIQPLADYGGGSGCGAVYIDEPGFGDWNNAPFTADWGTGALYHHQLKPKGATFEETRKPEPFIKMTRPTDADVDGMSRVYCASWKGATFNWEGPDVGYIVQVRPKGFKPEPLPDFAKAKDEALVGMLDLKKPLSYRRRIEAQRELLRRGSKLADSYLRFYEKLRTPERNSIDLIRQEAATKSNMDYVFETLWSKDESLAHTSIRALATHHQPLYLLDAFQNNPTGAKGNSTDLWTQRLLKALAMIHKPEVVTGLIERLDKATDSALRQGLLAALCRLHFKEGEWKGDSWGTRPDTRGPYYQPEAWSETPRIAVALKAALTKAEPGEAAFLVKELNRNRIQFNEAQQRILALAKADPKVVPELAAQLAGAEEVPAEAVPLLVGLVGSVGSVGPVALAQAITALAKTDSAEGVSATLAALEPLKRLPDSGKDYEAALTAFLTAPKLENHHLLLEDEADKAEWPVSVYAYAALLNLANRKGGSPESIQLSQRALDQGWAVPKQRKLIIDAISASKHLASAAKVLAALDDSDAEVKGAAERAAKAMRLQKIEDKTPKLANLKPAEILNLILKEKGDVALGEQIFTKATCVACHTVKESEAQKGPYLGNIAQTYKRRELAEAILDPNKTIAQGFASEAITLKDGTAQMGFITLEGADEVKLRTIAAQEFTFKTADIKGRQKLPISMMPPGLMTNFSVKEFASLLDYLEVLAK
jgi:putative membrane-bound dehydrogenase-like protein